MHSRSCILIACSLAVPCWLLGCGTQVIRSDDGEGGNLAEGGAPANPTNGGGTAGPGTGGCPSAASAKEHACNNLCATWGTCNSAAGCVEDCVAEEVPICLDEWVAYVECLAGAFNGNCQQDVACDPEFGAYGACIETSSCTGYSCNDDDLSCSCNGTCKGTSLEQVCTFNDGGMNLGCDCFENGTFLGSCTMNGNACNIAAGCCLELL